MASKSFQDDARRLAGSEYELTAAELAFADVAAKMAFANAGASVVVRRRGLDAAHDGPLGPAELCRQPTGEAALKEIRALPPFLRHFLWRFVSLSYRPPGKRAEKSSGLAQRPDDDLGARALSLLPVLGVLLGAHQDSDLAALSQWHRRFAMDLLLTDGGLTEKVYDRVRRELGIPSARTTRRCIEEASESLDARQVLTANLPAEDQPAEDEVVVLCGSVDNANVIRDGKESTKLGVGMTDTTLHLKKDEAEKLKALKSDLIPDPDDATVGMQALTAEDEKVMADVVRLQNIQALQFAATQLLEEGTRRPQQQPPQQQSSASVAVGDKVTFRDSNRNCLTGVVIGLDAAAKTATVRVKHGSGQEEERSKTAAALRKVDPPNAADAPTIPAETAAAATAKRRKWYAEKDAERLAMECEVGRERVRGNPTAIVDVLHHVDSKHHAAAAQGYEALQASIATTKNGAGMPFVLAQVDHEFSCSLQSRALLSKDEQAALIMPAYGHMLKAMATGRLAFMMSLWSRRFMEAIGLEDGKPDFNKMANGSQIRKTVKHVLMEDFVLRVAAAKVYLKANEGEVAKFTDASTTPSAPWSAFSTRPTHAAHVIPLTANETSSVRTS